MRDNNRKLKAKIGFVGGEETSWKRRRRRGRWSCGRANDGGVHVN